MERIQTTQFVMAPGFWLGAWAWDEVAMELRSRGFGVTALTLPGLEPERTDRAEVTLDDQAEAMTETLAAYDGEALLVIHSGATFPSALVLDRDPNLVRRAVYVDSGPAGPGQSFDAATPEEAGELPLPDFDSMGPLLGDLTPAQLETFRERSVPEPARVARDAVVLRNDEARRAVPTNIVTSTYPSAELLRMARDEHPMMAETGRVQDLTVVDLPTGHWPMWSRPKELAGILSDAAG